MLSTEDSKTYGGVYQKDISLAFDVRLMPYIGLLLKQHMWTSVKL